MQTTISSVGSDGSFAVNTSFISDAGEWDIDRSVCDGPCERDSFPMTWTAEEMGRIVRAMVARKARAA